MKLTDRRSAGAGLLYNARLVIGPASFQSVPPTQSAIRYRQQRARGVRPLLDVYAPPGRPPVAGHPSVLLFHGGGFLIGSRRMKAMRFLAGELSAAGFLVACPDYRLIFRGGRLDEQLADLAAARAFWETQRAPLRLDPARVSAVGLSAGASLMLLHAAAAGAPLYRRLVSIYGLYELDGLSGPAGLVKRWLTRSRDPATWAARSPLARADAVKPPLLVIHGGRDRLIPLGQAERLVERRRAAGLPTELERFEGMRHGWLNDARLPESEAVVRRVVGFLQDGRVPER